VVAGTKSRNRTKGVFAWCPRLRGTTTIVGGEEEDDTTSSVRDGGSAGSAKSSTRKSEMLTVRLEPSVRAIPPVLDGRCNKLVDYAFIWV